MLLSLLSSFLLTFFPLSFLMLSLLLFLSFLTFPLMVMVLLYRPYPFHHQHQELVTVFHPAAFLGGPQQCFLLVFAACGGLVKKARGRESRGSQGSRRATCGRHVPRCCRPRQVWCPRRRCRCRSALRRGASAGTAQRPGSAPARPRARAAPLHRPPRCCGRGTAVPGRRTSMPCLRTDAAPAVSTGPRPPQVRCGCAGTRRRGPLHSQGPDAVQSHTVPMAGGCPGWDRVPSVLHLLRCSSAASSFSLIAAFQKQKGKSKNQREIKRIEKRKEREKKQLIPIMIIVIVNNMVYLYDKREENGMCDWGGTRVAR